MKQENIVIIKNIMNLEVLKIASNNNNSKVVKDFTHYSKQRNSLCGDQIEITLKIKDNVIIDIGYQSKACIYCEASASLISRKFIKKRKNNLKQLINLLKNWPAKTDIIFPKKWKDFKKLFNNKNLTRKDCLLLPFKAIDKKI